MTSPAARKALNPQEAILLIGTEQQPCDPHSGRNVHSSTCGGGEFTLLPCPFCGAAANLVDNGRSRYMWRYAAQCSGCGVITIGFVTAREAVTRWNGRVKP
jgi:Lar family restriction alleviation protein